MKKALRCQLVYIMLVVLFIVAVFMNINTGNVHISFGRIFKIIFLKAEAGTAGFNIIWKIRLPRLLSAAILGGAWHCQVFCFRHFSEIRLRVHLYLVYHQVQKCFLQLL